MQIYTRKIIFIEFQHYLGQRVIIEYKSEIKNISMTNLQIIGLDLELGYICVQLAENHYIEYIHILYIL